MGSWHTIASAKQEVTIDLRYLEVSGGPARMGEAQGEAFRDAVHAFAELRIERAVDFVRKYDPGRRVSRSDIIAVAGRLVESHSRFDGPVWDEFDGISRAAGLSHPELLVANGLTDLRDYVLLRGGGSQSGRREGAESGGTGGDCGECTTFGAPGTACEGGHPIIGQTWDMHPEAAEYLVVVRREPAEGPATLSLTTVGCLSLIGLNAEGVGVCTSNLIPTDARDGVNYLFIITRALREASAAAAADVIAGAPRLSGHNFLLCDTSRVINVEATAERSETTPADDVHVHANHYRSPALAVLALERAELGGSEWRVAHLAEGLRSAKRPLTADACWGQLADNTRGEGAVCNEDFAGEYGEVVTAATAVLTPAAGQLLACAGGARLGTQETFRL